MRLPSLNREALPPGRAALVQALADASVQDGYVHARTHKNNHDHEMFLFLHQGRAWCAGVRDASSPSALSVAAFLNAADSFDEVALCRTDLPLFLCTAVLFRKPPAAHVPAALVDGETLMKSLQALGKDAVLAVENKKTGDVTLAFCRSGEPVALYASTATSSSSLAATSSSSAAAAAAPSAEGDCSTRDRLLELVYTSPGDLTLDVYDEIRLPPAAGAGQTIAALAHSHCDDGLRRPTLVVFLGDRVVFRHHLHQAETVIGRGSDADLALDNLSISRRHAIARIEGDRVVVEDLGSENGLVLQGALVKRAVLRPGDIVGVGKYRLAYTTLASHAPAVTSASTSGSATPRARATSEDIETINVVRSGALLEHQGKRHKIASAVFTIGSAADAHVRVRGLFVSPVHAVLQSAHEGYRVERIGSFRALRVNGRIVESAHLFDGDEITVAGETLRFRASPF